MTLFHDVVSSPVAFPTKGRLPVAFPPTSVGIIVNGLKTGAKVAIIPLSPKLLERNFREEKKKALKSLADSRKVLIFAASN